jgi:hypothetical protein
LLFHYLFSLLRPLPSYILPPTTRYPLSPTTILYSLTKYRILSPLPPSYSLSPTTISSLTLPFLSYFSHRQDQESEISPTSAQLTSDGLPGAVAVVMLACEMLVQHHTHKHAQLYLRTCVFTCTHTAVHI